MTARSARPAYAALQARLQARHGDALRTINWPELEAARSLAQGLAVARSSALAPWIEGIDASFPAARIDRMLRERWFAYVAQVAAWLPAPWRPATRWFGLLPQLPQVDAVRSAPVQRAGSMQAAAGETLLAPAAAPLPPAELRVFAGRAAGDTSGTAALWRTEWLRRVPADEIDAGLLRQPAQLLMPALFDARRARGAHDDAVRRRLLRLFRRFAFTPMALFAHLALVALDLERLRGVLLVRSLLAGDAGPERG